MKLKKLALKNYRNIKNIEIFPSDNINVIYGENAQGKTNLLESIWLLTGAKSFRGAKDNELVNFDGNLSVINAEIEGAGIEKDIKIEIQARRKAFLNGKALKNGGALAGNFNAIVFSPTDLKIVNSGPLNRRKFLDIAIGQIYPAYIELLREYNKALAQRNFVLKQAKKGENIDFSILTSFEESLSQNGEKIVRYRKRYLEKLKPILSRIYSGITREKEKVDISYVSVLEDEDYLDTLKYLRQFDMANGITSVGPHRDDIEFEINNISAKSFASQGQMRSIALSLKLSEAEVIKEITGEYPVALLDDVMSELDLNRQEYILNHIDNWQVFITCCEPDIINRQKKGTNFHIKDGKVI